MVDITILLESEKCKDIIKKNIDLCTERKITTEIIMGLDPKNAIGKYIAIIKNNTFYNDYYLHVCYISMDFANVPKNRLIFDNWAVFDKNVQEFYVGKATKSYFYKRETGNIGSYKTIKKVFPGCTTELLHSKKDQLPEDNILIEYGNHFND